MAPSERELSLPPKVAMTEGENPKWQDHNKNLLKT